MAREDTSRLNRVDMVRVAWGALLLAHPQPLLQATGTPPDNEAALVARLLGCRHVAQGVALAALPHLPSVLVRVTAVRRWARRAGALADGAHAASAFGLAAAGVAPVAWGLDGLVASAVATATWRSTTA